MERGGEYIEISRNISNVFRNCYRRGGGELDKKWTNKDIDENDEEGKNIDFWKIFEIAIEEGKKKLI